MLLTIDISCWYWIAISDTFDISFCYVDYSFCMTVLCISACVCACACVCVCACVWSQASYMSETQKTAQMGVTIKQELERLNQQQ